MTHRFGSHWTDAKLAALREYLTIYSKALEAQPFRKVYIDAFAGTGRFMHKAGGDEKDGSALIALGVGGFDSYTFIDLKPEHAKQLNGLKAQFPHADIKVICGDANDTLQSICGRWPSNQRGVVFLDPYGMATTWQTLQAIRSTGAIDVWYLSPLSGFLRQLTRDPAKRDSSKNAALDRVLGTPNWRTELYQELPIRDLFSPQTSEERVQPEQVRAWLTRHYEGLFPYVEEVAVLRMGNQYTHHSGAPLFSLYFMMGNRSKTAVALARKFVQAVRNKLQRENILAR